MFQFGNRNVKMFASLQAVLHWLGENPFPPIPLPRWLYTCSDMPMLGFGVVLKRVPVRIRRRARPRRCLLQWHLLVAVEGLFLGHSGTAFTGVLLCVDLTGAASVPILALLNRSLNKVPVAPHFSEKERVCDTPHYDWNSYTKRKNIHSRSQWNQGQRQEQENKQNRTRDIDRSTNGTITYTTYHLRRRSVLTTFFLRGEIGTETDTHPFAVYLDPFSSFLHLSFPTLCLLFFPSCHLSSLLQLYTFCVIPQPTTEKVLLVHRLVFSD